MTDYDSFATAYARENESSLLNRWYNRPAVLALAGDVAGRRVLDAGCGSGPLAADLLAAGALVSALDGSRAMVDLARERLGDDVEVHVADLGAALPLADDAFDDVVASLVLHYLEDWTAPLRELRRVLRPGGRVILSVPHPSAYLVNYPSADYFAVTQYTETFDFAGQTADLTYWHRPLHAMTDAFTAAGFRMCVVGEPSWSADTPADLLPPELAGRTAFVCFLFFVLESSGPDTASQPTTRAG